MIEFNATFIIAMLSFVVFIFIMNAIFYRPVLNIMRKRDEYIASNYEASKESINTAKELETERASQIAAVQAKCRKEFNDAVGKFQTEASERIKTAKEQNKAEIANRKNKLSEDEAELSNALKTAVVGSLADTIMSKLLSGSKIEVKN